MCTAWLLELWSLYIKKSIFTCGICMDTMPTSERFESDGCSHSYCSRCISRYIAVKVQDNIAKISCPSPRCPKSFDPISCRPILESDTFERWCDALCESAVLRVSRAYCPFKDCSMLVLNECNGSFMRAKCPHCKRRFCFQCQAPLHKGRPCNKKKMREDVLFYQLMEREEWQICPNCNHCVESKGGCFRMTCRCRGEFCYECGSELSWLHRCKLK